jgi:uncharacterized protein (TIGR02058 family)
MALKRFVIELGYGADLHGGDMTKAACRAVQDALSRSCLCGLFDILDMSDPRQMHVAVRIGCPKPEQVEGAAVLEMIPFGTRELEVVAGGLSVKGVELPELGGGDRITAAVAALTVWVDCGSGHGTAP